MTENINYYENLNSTALELGACVKPNIEYWVDRINEISSRKKDKKNSVRVEDKKSLPAEIRTTNDDQLRKAGAFYTEMIAPLLAIGKDSFKPTENDILTLCKSLSAKDAVKFVSYYALSKSRSPKRTGSPDTLIDLAEIEMLKVHAQLTNVADKLGFSMQSIIVDETAELPVDNILGFSEKDRETNQKTISQYINDSSSTNKVIVRPLDHSVRVPLGEKFTTLYESERSNQEGELRKQVEDEVNSPATIRMKVFIDCIPDEGLKLMNLIESEIVELRNNLHAVNLSQINKELYEYLIGLTSHFAAIMKLRSSAELFVKDHQLFPEYSNCSKIYGGVTRSTSRWSFLPNPTKWQGKTINPMHGLAIYDERGVYRGVEQYLELNKIPNVKILYIGQKPVAARLQN